MEYQDRDVVVTGGTGALGTALVKALIGLGARCHVPYMNEQELRSFAHSQHEQVRMHAAGDLSDETVVASLYGDVKSLWASIHIAGGFAYAPIADSNKGILMAQLETNLVSAYLCSRAAVMAFRAGNAGGRIVNIAARQALEPRLGKDVTAYAAAKAGVAAFTLALAEEVAHEGILVNAVAPSIMDTAANRRSMPKADFNAWPKVEEVAATIVFLASPSNQVTRGAVVPVYGKS